MFHPVKVSQKEKMCSNCSYHLEVTRVGQYIGVLSHITLERGASDAQWIPHAYNSSTMMGDGSVVARDPSRLVSRGGSSKEGRELNDSAVTC